MSLMKHLVCRGIVLALERDTQKTCYSPRDEDYFHWPRAMLFEVQRVTFHRWARGTQFCYGTETLANTGRWVMNTWPLRLKCVLVCTHD